MPKLMERGVHALRLLQETTSLASKLIEQILPQSAFDIWIEDVKRTIRQIGDCDRLEDVVYAPPISTIFKKRHDSEPIAEVEPDEQRAHIHADKFPTAKPQDAGPPNTTLDKDVASSNSLKCVEHPQNKLGVSEPRVLPSPNRKLNEWVISSAGASSCQASFNKTDADQSKSIVQKTSCNSEFSVFSSPKQGLCSQVECKSSILAAEPISGPQIVGLNETFKITPPVRLENAQPILEQKTPAAAKPSAAEFCTPVNPERRAKRKSSLMKETSNKRKKINLKEAPVASGSKLLSSKNKVPRHGLKGTAASSSKKAIVSVIEVPAVKKASVVPKEVQIMKEIKKKEEKANQNRQKILAEKQLKAEESKKKREERRLKMKKLLMEKEKYDLELQKAQADLDLKKQLKPARLKEMIDQNAKENTWATVNSTGNSQPDATVVCKTPVSCKKQESENYDMTPLPDYSLSDSDNEETRSKGKPIPNWAQGVLLKSALFHQYHNPPNTDELFGNCIEVPDLSSIFQVQKKRYLTRTSSAVWNTPPAASIVCSGP